jgi:hypothetical protein
MSRELLALMTARSPGKLSWFGPARLRRAGPFSLHFSLCLRRRKLLPAGNSAMIGITTQVQPVGRLNT